MLFCDLVGFTSRAERLDPEDVRALQAPYWAAVRAELERHGGTVEKFIGDAVVALFGAPTAHEDDPERAVRTAFAIRDAVQGLNAGRPEGDLRVRIAVATGEALVALGARPGEGEGIASGDVLNTAARLQAAAPVDGVLVDEPTFRATERAIVYRDADPVHAKGKELPVAVWEAVEPHARLGVDVLQAGRAPLVGRREELDLLLDALGRARHERTPQLITLVGEPGIGKSRLVWELLQAVEADPELIFWRQGRCLPYGEGVTYWALGEMVKAQAGILETDAAEAAAGKLARAVSDLAEEPADARWVDGHLRPLVGLAGVEELRGDRRGEAFAAWRRFFEALADQSPVVLVFEDLHWADEGLLDFVDHLVDWASGVPLFVVGTARPELLERRPGWGGGKRNALTISLAPLSDEDTARLVAALLERAVLPVEVQRAVLGRAGGNPLYAEEYVRMLRDRPAAEELPLPETVQGVVAARLDTLRPEEKELLQDASVVGKVVWVGALAAIAHLPRWEVEERLHALERREFVQRARRSSVAAETEYAFRHLLVRDVGYGQIPRARRGEKHRLAAEWIESLGRPEDKAELLAHHYLAALELAKAVGADVAALAGPARRALEEAGGRAYALSAFSAAVRYYGGALELAAGGSPERARLLLAYGRSQHEADELAGREALEEARTELLELAEREGAAEAETLIADILWRTGRQDSAFERLEAAALLLVDAPPSRTKAFVLEELSRLCMLAERNEEAIRVGRDALAMAEALGLAELQAEALNNVGTARTRSGEIDGLSDLERSIEIAAAANAASALERGRNNLASLAGILGDLRRTFELHRVISEAAKEVDRKEVVRWMRGVLALDHYFAGDWPEAIRLADDAIAESQAGARHYLESYCRVVRGQIRLARGDVLGALADAEAAAALARPAKDPQLLLPVLAFCARALQASGHASQSEALVAELLESSRGDATGGSLRLADLVWLLAELGREADILDLVGRARVETPWLAAYRSIAAGDFPRAAKVFAEIGALPYEADARLRAAELFLVRGRRGEGQAELERALAFFREVGASPRVRRAEALLPASA